jgi:hypothetical protein
LERFITGIYNYCDYWCDRCAFTRRCRNFAMDPDRLKGDERGGHHDATNHAFWNRLAEQLRHAAIFGKADQIGDARSDEPTDADWDEPFDPGIDAALQARERAVDTHPLTGLSRDYMMQADAWLKSADADLQALAREWLDASGARFDETDYEEAAREVGELIDVVAWYHTLIHPKLARAIGNLVEPVRGDGEGARIIRESRLYDANGSGKVALIAIERSIAAWLRLREILPRQEDAILAMLVLLDRMRRRLRIAIPGAEAFKRPGFDSGATLFDESDE